MTLLRLITVTVVFGLVLGMVGPFQVVGTIPVPAPLGVAFASAFNGLDAIGLTGMVSAGRGGGGGDGGGSRGGGGGRDEFRQESRQSTSDRSNSGAQKAQQERAQQESARQNQEAQRRRDQENQQRQQQQQQQQEERQRQQQQQQQQQVAEQQRQQQQQQLEQQQKQQQQQLVEQQKQKLLADAQVKEKLAATQPGLSPGSKDQERDEAARLRIEASAPDVPALTDEQKQQLDAKTQERVKADLAKTRETDLQRWQQRELAQNLQKQAQAPELNDLQRKELIDKANGLLAQSEKPGQPSLTPEQRQQVIDGAKLGDELANDPGLTPTQRDVLRGAGASMADVIQKQPGDLTAADWDRLHQEGSRVADLMRDPNITEPQRNSLRRWLQAQQPIYIESCRNSICIDGKPPINNGNTNGNGNSNGNGNGNGNDNNNCNDNGHCNQNGNCNDNDDNCNGNGNGNGNDNDNCNDNGNCNDNVTNITNITNITHLPDAPPENAVGQCLSAGGNMSVQAPNAQVIATAFNPVDLYLSLIDNAIIPPPPVRLLGSMALQVNAYDCGSTVPHAVLTQEINLNVTYSSEFAVANDIDTSRLSIYYLNNGVWEPAPKQANVPSGNAIAVTVTQLGVYAMVQE